MARTILLVIAVFICASFGCLITNCPRGGKRGDVSMPANLNWLKKCSRCGPKLLGQCFGPNICCGSKFGCYIGTVESHKCRGENLYADPCIAGFSMCRDNTGRCAANGICCSQESCYVDSTCRIEDDYPNESKVNPEYSRIIVENDP